MPKLIGHERQTWLNFCCLNWDRWPIILCPTCNTGASKSAARVGSICCQVQELKIQQRLKERVAVCGSRAASRHSQLGEGTSPLAPQARARPCSHTDQSRSKQRGTRPAVSCDLDTVAFFPEPIVQRSQCRSPGAVQQKLCLLSLCNAVPDFSVAQTVLARLLSKAVAGQA